MLRVPSSRTRCLIAVSGDIEHVSAAKDLRVVPVHVGYIAGTALMQVIHKGGTRQAARIIGYEDFPLVKGLESRSQG